MLYIVLALVKKNDQTIAKLKNQKQFTDRLQEVLAISAICHTLLSSTYILCLATTIFAFLIPRDLGVYLRPLANRASSLSSVFQAFGPANTIKIFNPPDNVFAPPDSKFAVLLGGSLFSLPSSNISALLGENAGRLEPTEAPLNDKIHTEISFLGQAWDTADFLGEVFKDSEKDVTFFLNQFLS